MMMAITANVKYIILIVIALTLFDINHGIHEALKFDQEPSIIKKIF